MNIGDRYKTKNHGELEVTEYNGCANVAVLFIKTGFTTTAEAGDIRKGNVRDPLFKNIFGVGYCGVGNEKQSLNGLKTKAYSAWYNMLNRCYGNKKRYDTYKDVTVCEAWHNYQNFSKWFNENYIEGMEMDKDLLSGDKKTYSPETCCFIPHAENTSIARAMTFTITSPDGEVVSGFNVSDFCRENKLSPAHISSVMSGKRKQHKGWTVGK